MVRLFVFNLGMILGFAARSALAADAMTADEDDKAVEDMSTERTTANDQGPVPLELLTAYQRFVKAAQAGDVEALKAFCLDEEIMVTNDALPFEDRRRDMLSLPYLKDGFSPGIAWVWKLSDDAFLIRTKTSCLRFVETKNGQWKLYRYKEQAIW
jgi:hypothetical protein